MIFDIAIGLTWIAAGYRVWIFVSKPRRIWRTAFSVSMVATALAFTLYRFRLTFDELLGVPNLSGLLAHVVFAVGAGFLLIYLDALRLPDVSARRVATYLSAAGVAAVTMTIAWIAAPVHDRPLNDFLPLATHLPVVVYCVTFWSYLVWALAAMGWTCLARGRTFRRGDLARSISLLLIGVSAVAAIPAVLLWTASILILYLTGKDGSRLNALGDALLPWPVLVNATGVLSLLTVPYLTSLITAWWRGRQLKPLWEEMIKRYPHIHLTYAPSGGPLSRLQTRLERAIIEIHDALRIATVQMPDVTLGVSVETVANALRSPAASGPRVTDLLERVETRDADVRQVLALARAFRATAP